MPSPILAPLLRWFGKLSYPRLFLLTAILFIANTVILDPIPFVDELLLGLGALLLANWKQRGARSGADIEGDSTRQ